MWPRSPGTRGSTEQTLYNWRRSWQQQGDLVPATGKSAEQWSAAAKFAVVLQTAGLNGTELGAFCRERGLYPQQVARWRQAAQDANNHSAPSMQDHKELHRQHQEDQKEIKRLQRELRKKGEGPGRGRGAAVGHGKASGPLAGGRGGLIPPEQRQRALELLDFGIAAGARATEVARRIGVNLRSLQRSATAATANGFESRRAQRCRTAGLSQADGKGTPGASRYGQ